MKDARATIEKLLDDMRPLLLAAGVPKAQVHMRRGAFRINTCNVSFDWLHNIAMSTAYKDMVYAHGLRPQEIWDRYKLLEIEGLAEQVLLSRASKALLKRWRKQRPTMFAKDRETDTKAQPMDSCRR